MVYILIALGFWALSAIVRRAEAARDAREAAREARLRRERAEEAARVAALEREQKRQAVEQRKQAAEQAKQAAQIARHEKRMVALENSIERAEYTISTQTERVAELDAQLDRLLLLQAGTVPGGNEHSKYQEKITAKKNQIRSAEERIMKARQAVKLAKKEMEAA